jgi:hypothetical protein
MDTIKEIILVYWKPIVIALSVFAVVCIVMAYHTIRRYTSLLREGFVTQKASLESLYTEDQCPIIKNVLDMYTQMLTSKDIKKEHGLTLSEVNITMAMFNEFYTNLNCEDYLAKLARGEIAPKMSSPDQRPEGYEGQIIYT